MKFYGEQNLRRWFIIGASLIITGLIVWNAVIFFQQLKEDERRKMNIWTAAQISLRQADVNTDMDLILAIINSNTTMPTIWVDEKGEIVDMANIPEMIKKDPEKTQNYLTELKSENRPITMDLGEGEVHVVYYGNSPLLNRLKYYPLVLYIVILLFIATIYFFYTTTKSSEQNKLWAGMAKETAHQIGTPLSSLIGWTELLKEEKANLDYIVEMEKDVERLRTITERFSKIGSVPKLVRTDIVDETRKNHAYLQSRSSKLIQFNLEVPQKEIFVNLNQQLYSWTIENLVKNAIDAMRGKGILTITISEAEKKVFVAITDTGKGLPKGQFNKIFEPGYTSKKRGWGLGLSLAKRIIEEYHKGKIKVARSELEKGTTFMIKLPKA